MKFVIFDIDGTLANTKKVEDQCFMKAFEETFGIDIWNQKWETLKHVTDWGITEEIIEFSFGRKPNNEEYEMMISNFIYNLKEEYLRDPSQFEEVAGAKQFFDGLKLNGIYKLGIATGSWEKSARFKLESMGIGVDDICFCNSDHYISRAEITKDVIDQLKRKYGPEPDQIIYFGDGEWDYKTCNDLGIDFIGIDVDQDGKLKSLGAEIVWTDFAERALDLSKIFKK